MNKIDKIKNILAKYKIFRKIFNLDEPYEYDELLGKWLEMKKPKGD